MQRGDWQPRLRRGETVGRYVVLSLVGRGAMGEVYKAHDTALDRAVALKILTFAPGNRHLEESIAVREGQMLARVRHPGVVGVFDVGVHSPSTFIALEYVEGKSLRDAIGDRELGAAEVRSLACQLAEGLCAIHQAGLIHRDIKPGNILIDETGSGRIADLGVAKLAIDMTLDGEGTEGTWVGTAGYRAPEVEAGGRATQAADVYSLCASLCEAVPDPPTRAWRSLLRVLRRGTDDDPSRRPTSRQLTALLRPGPRRWSWLAAVVSAGAIAVAVTRSADPEPTEDPLAAAELRLGEVWNPSVVARLHDWARAAGAPGEDWTRREIVRALTQRAEGWKQAAVDIAALGESEYTVLHHRCLDAAMAGLGGAIESTLAREGPPDPLLAWIHHLPVAHDCLRSDLHRRPFAEVPNADAARHLEDLARLQRAEGAIYLGDGSAAAAIIDELAARDDLGVLDGHVAYLQGLLVFKTEGTPAKAAGRYREAIVAGETYADRLLVARATVELSRMLVLTGDFDEARFAVRRTVAALGPRPGAELLTLQLLDAYSNIEGQLGTPGSRLELRRHLDEIETRIDSDGYEALHLHMARAKNDPDQAEEDQLAAWQLSSVYMGPTHEQTRTWRERYVRDACGRMGVESCTSSYEELREELEDPVLAVTMQAYALSRAGYDWAAWDLRSTIEEAMHDSGKPAQQLIGTLTLIGMASADPLGSALERSEMGSSGVERIVAFGLPEYVAGARMLAANIAASRGDRSGAESHLRALEALALEDPVVQRFARARTDLMFGASARALEEFEALHADFDTLQNNLWLERPELDELLCRASFEAGSLEQVTTHCTRVAEETAAAEAVREQAMVRLALRLVSSIE